MISRSSFVLAALLAAPASSVTATRDVVVSATQPEYAHFAHVNGTTLRYQLTGSGPQLIVLLHEMGMTLETWDSIVPELARTHRVLRYDLRGFGLSEKLRGAVTLPATHSCSVCHQSRRRCGQRQPSRIARQCR